MSSLEPYKIELLIEAVIDLKRHRIQSEFYVFYDMWSAPEHGRNI